MRLLRSLADWYFTPKRWESEALYRRLGLGLFLRYIPTGGTLYNLHFWHMIGMRRPHLTEAYLLRAEATSRMHESTHVPFALIMLAVTIDSLRSHSWKVALATAAANLALNIYPIMLQRWKRLRILRILASKYPHPPIPKAPEP